MGRGEQRRVGGTERRDVGAVVVHRQERHGEPARPRAPRWCTSARRPRRRRRRRRAGASTVARIESPWVNPAQTRIRPGSRVHPAGPGQVVGERPPELDPAARVAVARWPRPARLAGPGASAATQADAREGAEVGRARPEVEARRPRLRLGVGVAVVADWPLRDAGARAGPGLEPALGDQLGVGPGDRVARDAEVAGEGPRRRQPDARGEPPVAHGLAQRALERRPHPRARGARGAGRARPTWPTFPTSIWILLVGRCRRLG